MAAPQFSFAMPMQMGPPLPPGWTEHIAPGGQLYFYNSITKQSTYVRPLPTFPVAPTLDVPSAGEVSNSAKKKREKPLVKTPVPGTDWLRVKTTEGNVFYTNKAKKESVWVVPEEIKEDVEKLEKHEKEEEEKKIEEERLTALKLEEEEIERVKRDVEATIGKRKAAEDPEPLEEVIISKKPRVTDEEDEEDEASDDDDEEEEEWQREAAAQLAAEAEEEEKRRAEAEAEEAAKKAEEEEKEELRQREKEKGTLTMPARVDLSLDEAKALFKTLLREKDINPLLPWDTSIPLFISDPRYVLLPSVSARKDAFDEYCRGRARELRAAKVKAQAADGGVEGIGSPYPKEEFERLLREEVKSTRMNWNEWRRAWKKDRRFWGWGRDDREREKKFKDWLKELGEQKRKAAQKAERDFFALLKEKGDVQASSVWKETKRNVYKDPRYDAIGSSTLREELFNTFLKTLSGPSDSRLSTIATGDPSNPELKSKDEDPETTAEQKRKERRERAVREREKEVRVQQRKMEADMARTRKDVDQGEGENAFLSLLTDAIRDPMTTWDDSLSELKIDPRFTNSPLPVNRQLHLFHAHVQKLRTKHLNDLHSLFASHAPSLSTSFSSIPLSSLLSSLPARKLGLEEKKLEGEYEKWQRDRTDEARKAFDAMLGENSFVEFWGRLGKIGGEGIDGGIGMDDVEEEDKGEDGVTKVDMKVLAKSVDIREMEKVLKNDKRYIVFDHVPEQRERWLRDYLANLTAPKLSVHAQR